MRTWEEVANALVSRMEEYGTLRNRDVSRVRFGVKTLTDYLNEGKPYVMCDSDWESLGRALNSRGYGLLRLFRPSDFGVMDLNKTDSWTKISLTDGEE